MRLCKRSNVCKCVNQTLECSLESFRKSRSNIALKLVLRQSTTSGARGLKQRLIRPSVIMQKLNNQQSTTKLAKALTHLGRIVKTIYILRYLHDKEMRRAIRLQLNRVESRHSLVRSIFFADQGAFKTNNYTELMNKASCLSFVSNAVVLHNTNQLQNIYESLRVKGYHLNEEDMARIAPLSSKHITMHGIYNFY